MRRNFTRSEIDCTVEEIQKVRMLIQLTRWNRQLGSSHRHSRVNRFILQRGRRELLGEFVICTDSLLKKRKHCALREPLNLLSRIRFPSFAIPHEPLFEVMTKANVFTGERNQPLSVTFVVMEER